MKIFIRRSGGFANIEFQGELDTSDLPPNLAKDAHRLLKPAILKKAGKKNPLLCDGHQMSIGFRSADDEHYQEYKIDQASADAELFSVCNELVNHVMKNLQRQRKETS